MKTGWALDSEKELLHISEAESGANGYLCPICHQELIAKKGQIKEHHFAHKNHVEAHESPLHYAAKYILANMIEEGEFSHTKQVSFRFFDKKSEAHFSVDEIIKEIQRMN